VTGRATILALGRFQIAPEATVKQVERAWTKYRKEHGLDLYGTANDPTKSRALLARKLQLTKSILIRLDADVMIDGRPASEPRAKSLSH
jgi:hypothetical protein